MRQTEIENKFKEIENRLNVIEKILSKLKPKHTQQENYDKSVESKGLPKTKDEVSTTKTQLDGKSPVEVIKNTDKKE